MACFGPFYVVLYVAGYFGQAVFDLLESRFPVINRDVSQVNIHRQPGQVMDEEVKCCSPFKRKLLRFGDMGQGLDQQFDLLVVLILPVHALLPVRLFGISY